MNQPELLARYEAAQRIAREAGAHTLKYFGKAIDIERKDDATPVTIADREAEQLARKLIAAEFPEDAIHGEEFPAKEGTSGYRWVIDPIDGTKSFISGVPLYSTLVAVQHEDRSVIGVIQLPALQESVCAAIGHGAWHDTADGRVPAKVDTDTRLADGLFVTSQNDSFAARGAAAAFARLESAARITRTWGDGYGYVLVATGRAVAMVDPIVSLWDVAAMPPIFIESGGYFGDWWGHPGCHQPEGIAATPGALEDVLAITRDFPHRDASAF